MPLDSQLFYVSRQNLQMKIATYSKCMINTKILINQAHRVEQECVELCFNWTGFNQQIRIFYSKYSFVFTVFSILVIILFTLQSIVHFPSLSTLGRKRNIFSKYLRAIKQSITRPAFVWCKKMYINQSHNGKCFSVSSNPLSVLVVK